MMNQRLENWLMADGHQHNTFSMGLATIEMGLTYKMSQASWNPENLAQSTIQVLRDPGWLWKWIGSVLIVSGIFMLFYVKSFRRPSSSGRSQIPAQAVAEKEEKTLVSSLT